MGLYVSLDDWQRLKPQLFIQKVKPKEATFRINAWIEDTWDKRYFKEQYLHMSRCDELWEKQRAIYVNPWSNQIFDVENMALYYYFNTHSLTGIHSENGLGKTLFGVFMWDVIFDDQVTYVFQSAY